MNVTPCSRPAWQRRSRNPALGKTSARESRRDARPRRAAGFCSHAPTTWSRCDTLLLRCVSPLMAKPDI